MMSEIVIVFSCVSMCILRVNYFFFFKQKTAYEMRISDWSSDVCSSDLYAHRPRSDIGGVGGAIVGRDGDHMRALLLRRDRGQQIGRASCRERVCQYV